MRYCIIYALTNLYADERISVALVCQTKAGWVYKFSETKIKVSQSLLPEKQGEYVWSFVTDFQKCFLDGRSQESVLSNLETLRRYCNNYVVFSPVREMTLEEPLMTPERLYRELIEP